MRGWGQLATRVRGRFFDAPYRMWLEDAAPHASAACRAVALQRAVVLANAKQVAHQRGRYFCSREPGLYRGIFTDARRATDRPLAEGGDAWESDLDLTRDIRGDVPTLVRGDVRRMRVRRA